MYKRKLCNASIFCWLLLIKYICKYSTIYLNSVLYSFHTNVGHRTHWSWETLKLESSWVIIIVIIKNSYTKQLSFRYLVSTGLAHSIVIPKRKSLFFPLYSQENWYSTKLRIHDMIKLVITIIKELLIKTDFMLRFINNMVFDFSQWPYEVRVIIIINRWGNLNK